MVNVRKPAESTIVVPLPSFIRHQWVGSLASTALTYALSEPEEATVTSVHGELAMLPNGSVTATR